jgi:4-hydroxy-3-methylbut-2-enyl diphosphate reductase
MAIDCLEQVVSRTPPPVYAYHQIVHNNIVVGSFQRRGVVFVDDINRVPVGSTVVLSAHGVAPRVHEQASKRKLRVIDATCPLVTKVHLEARRFAKEGVSVVLIGHRGHDEVVGIEGEVPGCIQTIESREEIDLLQIPDPDRVAALTQTTLSFEETRATLAELKSRFPKLRLPPKQDVCYATQNRQEALRAVLPQCQLALILGSRTSSNAQRLRELAVRLHVASLLIEEPEQIDHNWFAGVVSVALTAAASVPEEQVEAVLHWLTDNFVVEIEDRVVKTELVSFIRPVAAAGLSRSGSK